MRRCPRCGSDRIHFSRTRSGWEAWRKQITAKRPYRCSDCGWRGWGVDSGPLFSPDVIEASFRAMAPDPPNLKETALAREEREVRDVDLSELDSAIPQRSDAAEKN